MMVIRKLRRFFGIGCKSIDKSDLNTSRLSTKSKKSGKNRNASFANNSDRNECTERTYSANSFDEASGYIVTESVYSTVADHLELTEEARMMSAQSTVPLARSIDAKSMESVFTTDTKFDSSSGAEEEEEEEEEGEPGKPLSKEKSTTNVIYTRSDSDLCFGSPGNLDKEIEGSSRRRHSYYNLPRNFDYSMSVDSAVVPTTSHQHEGTSSVCGESPHPEDPEHREDLPVGLPTEVTADITLILGSSEFGEENLEDVPATAGDAELMAGSSGAN